MTLEQQYAHALHALVVRSPEKSAQVLDGLKKTLEQKGHSKLLPQIYAQYQRILERAARSEKYAVVTEEGERTRVLLELYRTLART